MHVLDFFVVTIIQQEYSFQGQPSKLHSTLLSVSVHETEELRIFRFSLLF